MSDLRICVRFAIIILDLPDKEEAVIEYIKRRGREIRESTFKTTKGRPGIIRLSKLSRLLSLWRLIMQLKNDHYTYRITWSAEDKEYVGLCAEFPSLSWLAKAPETALKGIRKVVAEVVEDMKKAGESIPEPIANRPYSGKFVVRVTPETHRLLAIQSAETGVSLNRLVSAKVSR
jgi:predicted HicB family RNase H-like nuclease